MILKERSESKDEHKDESTEESKEWGRLKHITISRDQTAASGYEQEQLIALSASFSERDTNSKARDEPEFQDKSKIRRKGYSVASSTEVTLTKIGERVVITPRSRASGSLYSSRPNEPSAITLPVQDKRQRFKARSISPEAAYSHRDRTQGAFVIQKFNTSSQKGTMESGTLSPSEGDVELTLEQLRGRVKKLELENADLKGVQHQNTPEDAPPKVPWRWQTFSVINEDETTYLDPPTWVTHGGSLFLRGYRPIRLREKYLEKQAGVAFVVFRVFSERAESKAVNETLEKDTPLPEPEPIKQRIWLYSEEMTKALIAFLEMQPNFQSEFPDFDEKSYLNSPFLFWYLYRNGKSIDELPEEHQDLMKLLIGWIDDNYGKLYNEVDERFSRGFVTTDTMQFLFRPGDVVVTKRENQVTAHLAQSWATTSDSPSDARGSDSKDSEQKPGPFSVIGLKATELATHWFLKSWTYGYDGNFYRLPKKLKISPKAKELDEEIEMKSLDVYPLRFADEEVRSLLMKRGETFWGCRSKKMVSYPADKIIHQFSGHGERYMVDMNTYNKLHPSKFKRQSDSNRYMKTLTLQSDEPPKEPDLLLFPPTLAGFHLRRKIWDDLDVDLIQDVSWNKDAFKYLVIDGETKELIHALITNKLVKDKGTDVIDSKGNGLIMLLHGGPGTGKTFTAESVAELAEKPLYAVTCGDIGTKPEDVEKYLESALHLGKIWDCVVLLDEADVFLEQRTLNDLDRNALVSVFLRVLEYYEGILVLTSNRVGIFDEAFKSRIQLALHYDSLGIKERAKIWRNFFSRLQKLGEENIDYDTIDSYIEELSEHEMNGRQIRNAITTSRQLAQFKGRPMTYGHLRHVIQVSGKFDKYLKTVHEDMTDDQIAREERFR